jgi:hypothetical protein
MALDERPIQHSRVIPLQYIHTYKDVVYIVNERMRPEILSYALPFDEVNLTGEMKQGHEQALVTFAAKSREHEVTNGDCG